MDKPLVTVSVDRAKLVWNVPDDMAAAMAYPDGTYDVFGAILHQYYDVPMNRLENMGFPSDVQECYGISLPLFVSPSNLDLGISSEIFAILDNEKLSNAVKEQALKTKLEVSCNIILDFVN